jgi:hypothetical protein
MQMQVQVPAGVAPGQGFMIQTPDGQRMQVTAPPGSVPGQTLTVNAPAPVSQACAYDMPGQVALQTQEPRVAYTYGIKGDASFYNLCPKTQGGKLTENKSIFGDAFKVEIPQPQAVPSELQAVLSLEEWQAFLDGVAACEASSMPGSALQAFYWFPVLGCITGIALMSCFNARLFKSYEAFSSELTKKGVGGGQVLFRARRLNADGKEAASFQAIEICFA